MVQCMTNMYRKYRTFIYLLIFCQPKEWEKLFFEARNGYWSEQQGMSLVWNAYPQFGVTFKHRACFCLWAGLFKQTTFSVLCSLRSISSYRVTDYFRLYLSSQLRKEMSLISSTKEPIRSFLRAGMREEIIFYVFLKFVWVFFLWQCIFQI